MPQINSEMRESERELGSLDSENLLHIVLSSKCVLEFHEKKKSAAK